VNELSLFSGYGGFSLGLRLAGLDVRTVGYVEIDPYCQDVLKARIQDGHLDNAPIWPDISAFNGYQCRGLVDIITAGFPCQPHSTAGKRQGESDPRNLWPDTLRVIREVGPRWVLLENVPGILANGYGGTVVGQLSEFGYDCRWGLVSAASIGAPHLRWRWWCLAYAPDYRLGQSRWATEQEGEYQEMGRGEQSGENGGNGDVAYTHRFTGTFRGDDKADANSRGRRKDNKEGSGRIHPRESHATEDGTLAHPQGTGWPTRPSEGESGGFGEVADPTVRRERTLSGSTRGQGQSTIRGACGEGGRDNDWWAAISRLG